MVRHRGGGYVAVSMTARDASPGRCDGRQPSLPRRCTGPARSACRRSAAPRSTPGCHTCPYLPVASSGRARPALESPRDRSRREDVLRATSSDRRVERRRSFPSARGERPSFSTWAELMLSRELASHRVSQRRFRTRGLPTTVVLTLGQGARTRSTCAVVRADLAAIMREWRARLRRGGPRLAWLRSG